MSNKEETTEKVTWTTWEELLLTCAVKRYGLKDWDSVAMELQNRSSLPFVLTAQICRNKFTDLKRRFTDKIDDHRDGGDEVEVEVDSIPWLEELRKLRVAELKQEVHRHDLSIQFLQLKVKRLEEARERSLKDNENDVGKPDLEKDTKEERSENDEKDGNGAPDDDVGGKSVSGDDSDGENRSFNESNSTENRETGDKVDEREPEPVRTGCVNPDPDSKPVGEDSWNDSSKPSEQKRVEDDSAELRDSVAESKERTKESSDVQSSASLTDKRDRRGKVAGGGDEPVLSPATIGPGSVKSEPLVGLLDMIRSHRRGSMFERRLESQKTEKYKNTVRQHMDLETVQTRIDDGSYSSYPTKFYSDLLLLFNNAIVFFPKQSPESAAAHELRHLILKELKLKQPAQQSDPSPEPDPILLQPKPDPERSDSLLAKQKSSAPIIVCRKRSSISAKPSSSVKTDKQPDEKPVPVVIPKPPVKSSSSNPNEEEGIIKLKAKEMPVTGARSMRKSTLNKNHVANSNSNPDSTNKVEPPKLEKKKADVTTMVKKRGAADFLKRIKKNSPVKETLLERLKSSVDDGSSNRRDRRKKRVEEGKEGMARLRSGGKKVKEEESPLKKAVGRPPKRGREVVAGKRGREGGETEVVSKRPKKRSRR